MADRSDERAALAEGIADYVETHAMYDEMTKREAVVAAVRVLTDDIGAAQNYLTAIGVQVDLFGSPDRGVR